MAVNEITGALKSSPTITKAQFLYPRSRYYGDFQPEFLAFDANLQEFSQKVSYISALESGGNLPPQQAYEALEVLWQKLSSSAQHLGISQ